MLIINYLLLILLILIIYVTSLPVEKYVLDTTTIQSELNWDKEAYGSSLEIPGWKEQSFSQKNGDVWRVYFVCDIASSNPDNWLRTPFIYKEDANRLILRLEYTIRECNKYPGAVRSCKETFQVLYAESDNDAQGAPVFNEANYKFLKTIAPIASTTQSSTASSSSSSSIFRTEVDVAISSKGLYFAFRDQGACVSILSIKVLYKLCSSQITNLVVYPKTPTGANVTDLVQRTGYCVDNAESKQAPFAYCQTNGNWFITNDNSDLCMCKAGYYYSTVNNNQAQCLECPQGTYKSDVGNTQCIVCPSNSWTPKSAYKSCNCNNGYFRPNESLINNSCIPIPTEPKNLTVYYLDQASVKLRWNSIGNYNVNTIQYIISCYKCNDNINYDDASQISMCNNKIQCENYTQYLPDKNQIFNNEVTLKSLDSNTKYFIEIYAKHVNNLFKTKTIDISIQTSKDIDDYELTNIKCLYIYETNEYKLLWNLKNKNIDKSIIQTYELKYWLKKGDIKDATILQFNDTFNSFNYTIKNLNIDLRLNYLFQLRMQTKNGWSAYTKPFEALILNTNEYTTLMTTKFVNSGLILNSDNNIKSENVTAYIALSVAGSLCFVIGILTIFLLVTRTNMCKRKNSINKKLNGNCNSATGIINSAGSSCGSSTSDCDSIDIAKRNAALMYNQFIGSANGGGSGGSSTTTSTTSSGGSSPLWQPMISQSTSKTYIDPHTYEDPTKAVNEFATELSPINIIIESVIGGGEFGDVCKGYLKHSSWCQTTVAIKTLKNAATEQNRCDFLTEASIMAQFNDPNVIHLEGVVTRSLPLMIVTEYMENGSLDTFLRLNESKLNIEQLIKILKDVASGMKYLSEMNFIHRDLAARNILVNKDLTCKVADFGLSREIENDINDGIYTTKGGKIPIRWTAPEAIIYRKFTCSSDVWSFGVLAWEVLNYGERPYWNWTNQDVLKTIEKCYRLPVPNNCPEFIYDLMIKCWNIDRLKRPKFTDIVIMLDYILKQSNDLTNKIAKIKETLPINPNKPTYVQLTSTKEFLVQIKLEQYLQNFENLELNNLSTLFFIQLRDLIYSLNITNVNHQKLIIESLNNIRNHFSIYYNTNSNVISNLYSTNTLQQQQQQGTLIPITIQQQQHQQQSIFNLINNGTLNKNNPLKTDDILILTSNTANNNNSTSNSNGYLV